jgi:hypothetical protein
MKLRWILPLAGALALHAGPVSSCTPNMTVGITCNVFETDAGGNPSEISNVFSLGTNTVAGYVVLLEMSGADQTNNANWSDVLHFIDDGMGFASTAQLLSAGCNCFPSFAMVNAAGAAFIVESATPPTVYSPGSDTYNIFSAEEVPEPGAAWLLAFGLIALGWRKRHLTT